MPKTYKFEHEIGEFLYVRSDPAQERRMITGIMITPGGIQYRLSICDDMSWFYDIEVSGEIDQTIHLGLKN